MNLNLFFKAPRSGPRPDWDPDIVEALDDDFDFKDPNNELEDNFMEMAMDGEEMSEDDEYTDEEDESNEVCSNQADYSGEENDEVGPLPYSKNFSYNDEETKSRFTEYSMSSSVIRRNEQLSLLDDRFEKFYENYDDSEVGAMDCEEIEGHVNINDDLLLQISKDFTKNEKPQKYNKAWDVCRLVKLQGHEDKEEEIVELEVSDDGEDGERKKKWDCESILSTYSNIYNHPKLIEVPSKKKLAKIQVDYKTGLPKNVFDNEQKGKLTIKSLAKLTSDGEKSAMDGALRSVCAESVISTLSVLSMRPKDETPEEKRERKKLLKEYRNERRIEKKFNKVAFNDERLRQNLIHINQKNNLQGNKIL